MNKWATWQTIDKKLTIASEKKTRATKQRSDPTSSAFIKTTTNGSGKYQTRKQETITQAQPHLNKQPWKTSTFNLNSSTGKNNIRPNLHSTSSNTYKSTYHRSANTPYSINSTQPKPSTPTDKPLRSTPVESLLSTPLLAEHIYP